MPPLVARAVSASPAPSSALPVVHGDQANDVRKNGHPSESPSSSSSDASSTYSVQVPQEVLTCILGALADLELLDTLSSFSLASKATHRLAVPILFHSIKIRNHRQLESILSSLETLSPDLAPGKRKTRLSGPKCDVQAKLERFRLTKHLSINHFPSLDNIARMAALGNVFAIESVFPQVESMTLAPILVHRLHPSTCGAAAQLTKDRLKGIHHLRILARPAHLVLDLRGADPDWASAASLPTPHGCVCIEDFYGRIGRFWLECGDVGKITIHLDPAILANHFLSTTATGPPLHIHLAIPPQPPQTTSTSQPKRKRSRLTSTESQPASSPPTMLQAISSFVLNRVRQADEHRGGKTHFHIPRTAIESMDNVDTLVIAALASAKEQVGEEELVLFARGRTKAMLKGFHFHIGDDESKVV